MFVRVQRPGGYGYRQIVHNERSGGKVRQRTVATLGRTNQLRDSGTLDDLAASLAKFSLHTAVLSAHREGRISAAESVRIEGMLFAPPGDDRVKDAVEGKLFGVGSAEFYFGYALIRNKLLCLGDRHPGTA